MYGRPSSSSGGAWGQPPQQPQGTNFYVQNPINSSYIYPSNPPFIPHNAHNPTKTSLLIISQSKALISLPKTLDLILLPSSFRTRQGFGLRTREICSRKSTAQWGRLATNMPLLEERLGVEGLAVCASDAQG
ncbi:uncharacterized protein Pyn_10523 [Prunus yedoensis var. nudiflora]|uniref:Uncharacterized protein n=1 Tax=Prunus yedoensis var. nudiflora TaxID=2094558 RepID=A0A314YHP9_PRUYE|nr:uncharacterized protein Pyn_10523 [Prunus yedoensis var. nudiflora]